MLAKVASLYISKERFAITHVPALMCQNFKINFYSTLDLLCSLW